MDSQSMKNYLVNSLCRICAEKSSKLIPIFDIKLLPLKIYKCLPIKVSTGDDLPVNICEVCLVKVDESYLLYETCYYADQRLKKLWKDLSKSDECDKDMVIHNDGYQIESLVSNSDVCNDAAKNVPVSVILVNDAAVFEQENQEFQKTSDVFIPNDIIINIGSEDSFNIIENEKGCELEGIQEFNKSVEQVDPVVDEVPNENKSGKVAEKITEGQQLSQEKPYLCDTCGKSFKHANNLKSHVKTHSAHRKKYTCKICNKTFFTNFFLQEHMNTHTGETPYKCQVCGKEFREKVHLRQHKWTHSTEKFLCPVCGNHFNRKGNMTEHIKKYHSSNEEEKKKRKKSEVKKPADMKFTCSMCSKTFSNQTLLKNHHKRHLNKEPHFCSICGKEFRHSGSLTYHRRTAHTGEKPFQCSYCEERFSLRSVQRIHERKKHTFEYPYKCTFCPRMFNNSSSLKNHSYVHMKEKMFGCDVCGKKFSRNSNLIVHKKIHSDDRQYTCEHCGKSYIQKHDLIKHKKIHDPKSKPFYCKYCGNSFAHKKDFSRHAICHYDYIRKSNSAMGSAEKILETIAGDFPKNSKSFVEVEKLFLESTDELIDEKIDKSDIT